MYYKKVLYIFFLILALNLSFFSTNKVNAKAFLIDEIEISEKLENNFNKDKLINKGFKKAFNKLMIWDWIETSSALTASSQTISLGFRERERAIQILCL